MSYLIQILILLCLMLCVDSSHNYVKFKVGGSYEEKNLYDVFPMYVCSNLSEGYRLSSWYDGCLSSCSLTSPPIYYQLEFFDTGVYKQNVVVDRYRCNRMCKRSHENTWGSCIVTITENSNVVLNLMDISLYHSSGCKKYEGNAVSCEDFPDPECDYLRDNIECGHSCLITQESWVLMSDIYGRTYFKSPESNLFIDCSSGFAQLSDSSFVWSTSICSSSTCMVKSSGFDECLQPYNNITYSCPRSGKAFSTVGMISVDSPCLGPVNVTADGVIFKWVSIGGRADPKDELAYAKSESPTDPIVALANSVNDVISVIEGTICTSICDIIERSFQLIPDNNDVVETPIGPWIPFLGVEGYFVIPCSSTSNYTLSFPLVTCGTNPMFMRVTDVETSLNYWWDPTKTFVSEETICIPSSSDLDYISTRLELNKSVSFEFWRGTAMLMPPNYTTVVWSDRMDYNSVRSSKWFARLSSDAILPSLTLSELNASIVSLVSSVKNSTEISKTNNSATSYPASDTIITIIGKISGDIIDISSSIVSTVVSMLSSWKDILVIAVTLVIGYVLIKVLWLLRLFRSKGKYRRANQESPQAIFYGS